MRIGIDLGGTKIEAIALDDQGNTLQRRRVDTPRDDYNAILNAMGEAYYNAGDVDRAIRIMERSLALYPEQPRIRKFLETIRNSKG